jgi:uncharacterized protein DUF5988
MDTPHLSADEDTIDAVLEGGPADLPASMRRRLAHRSDEKIKVRWGTGHEHFERTEEANEASSKIFRWTGRTKIAE